MQDHTNTDLTLEGRHSSSLTSRRTSSILLGLGLFNVARQRFLQALGPLLNASSRYWRPPGHLDSTLSTPAKDIDLTLQICLPVRGIARSIAQADIILSALVTKVRWGDCLYGARKGMTLLKNSIPDLEKL